MQDRSDINNTVVRGVIKQPFFILCASCCPCRLQEWERAISTGALRKSSAHEKELRKAVRESLGARASNAGAARKARLGRGKGQGRIAAAVVAQQSGKVDVYTRDARLDPAADL